MRRAVRKYSIEMGAFSLDLPKGATILAAQVQNDSPGLWALVDVDAPSEERRFRVIGTGQEIVSDETLGYVGTFQVLDGWNVLHLFEVVTIVVADGTER